MKNTCSTLLILLSILVSGCSYINQSSNNLSSSLDYEENQAFYNRLIEDFYNQKLSLSGFVTKEETGNVINVVNDGHKWQRLNSDFPFSKDGTYGESINQIVVNTLIKCESGAYVCNFDCGICVFQSGFQDVYGVSFYSDEEKVYFSQQCFAPFVWFDGAILLFNDAYNLGLISDEDIESIKQNPFSNMKSSSYDAAVMPLQIKTIYYPNNEQFNQLRNDYCSFINTNSIETINGNRIVRSDVHIMDDFGEINGKRMLVMASDNLLIQNRAWSSNYVVENLTIKPFNHYMPDFYINNSFYSISEAYESHLIDKNDLQTIIERFN